MTHVLLVLLGGLILAGTLMLTLWLVYRRIRKPHVVDVAWGFGVALVTAFYGIMGEGDVYSRALLTSMVASWGLRLSWHLLVSRILHPHRDRRYDALEQKWQKNIDFRYLLFYQSQAFFMVVLTAPFLAAMQDPRPGLLPLEIVGLVVWKIGLVGEAIADRQLKAFKADAANAGKVCDAGLWSVSRHPNYFFEWLIWVGFFFVTLPAPFGWLAVLGPAVMYWLLTRVTGIPMTEEQAIRSKGDLYRQYQQTTSPFFPWFKKTS